MEATLNPHRIVKRGQACILSLQVAWPSKEGDYRFSRPELVLENLTVEEAGESNETFQRNGEEWRRKEFRFQLKALRQGEGRIRAFSLLYVNPQTGEEGNLPVDDLKIKIRPDAGVFYRLILILLGLVLGMSLVGGWVLFLRHSSQKKHPNALQGVTLEDRYLSELHKVPSQLIEASRLFRSYLMEKYQITDGSFTTQELMRKMEGEIPANELKTLKTIFDKLEQYVFGRHVTQPGDQEIFRGMIRFIEGKQVV